MAIPDNYIDKFTKDGESRMISPAAEQVRVDNEHYEGDNLDDVLGEIDEKVSQAGTGNYTKPSTGIPKSDMDSAVQTSLGKADSAVQGIQINGGFILPKVHNNVDIFVPSRTSQLQNDSGYITEDDLPEGVECDTQMSSTSVKPVQNKVIKAYIDNLIAGLIDGAPAALDTLKELAVALSNNQDAVAALTNLINSKANASEVYSKSEVNTMIGAKQDVLQFDDAPTSGSNKPVKSGGIKQAIDFVTPTIDSNGKWVIGGLATDKDAQGPRGNTVLVNENAQGIQALIVNNVVDGGETDILSAEMGKVIRIAIMTIYNALSPYAFAGGKPVISWGSTLIKHVINDNGVTGGLSVSDVEVDGTSVGNSLPNEIINGKSLSFKLNLPSNMYVFDDDVTITMGGVDITNQTGVWNESTGEIYIDAVLGDVVITAATITYVGYGEQNSDLAFMLDCKNRGNQSGHWVDMIGNVDFTLGSGVTPADTGVEFDGTSNAKGVSSGSLNILFENATVEIVATRASASGSSPILSNTFDNGVSARTRIAGSSNSNIAAFACTSLSRCSFLINEILSMALSANTSRFAIGGVVSDAWGERLHDYITKKATTLAIGYHKDLSTNEETYLNGTIKAIRVYNHGSGGTKLSADDMIHNYKVDQKRFNLS